MTRHRSEIRRAAPRATLLARFRRDARGVTAIEFALISVPFLGLLMAIFQAGLFFFTSEALQAAVQDASRSLYTGQAQGANVTDATTFVNTYVCPQTGGTRLVTLIDCSKLIVDVRTAPTQGSFSNLDMDADFYQTGATTKFCPGGPNDIVIVRVIYPMPIFAPVLLTSTGKNVVPDTSNSVVFNTAGRKQIVLATSVFRNEPYSNNAAGGCS